MRSQYIRDCLLLLAFLKLQTKNNRVTIYQSFLITVDYENLMYLRYHDGKETAGTCTGHNNSSRSNNLESYN
jgi:hypothetical protein